MCESEARAQAFVSGFCIRDGRGMLGRPHGPWTNIALCGSLLFFVNLGDGRTPFSFVTSGVPPKEEFQSRALERVKGQPELWLKIEA